MKRVLIIGGEGYIGSVVSEELLQAGYRVRSLDNLTYGNNLCVLSHVHHDHYRFVFGDMTNREQVEAEVANADIVLLLAGLVGDPVTRKYPEAAAEVNDTGVKNVIDICSKAGTERFLFISTCSNYGLMDDTTLAHEDAELNPLSPYAESKVNAERYLLSLRGRTRMHATILRFATAFGLSPRMRFDLTISQFTRELMLGRELIVYDAHTWRPYCHVKDFAHLIQEVIEADIEKISFEVFNAGGDMNNATKQMIVDAILKHLPDGRVKYLSHGGDPRNYRVSFEKMKALLGFEPRHSIEDGITELVDAMENHVFDHVEARGNFHGNYEIGYPKQGEEH